MLIGISGRKQHGKDTVGSIINILLSTPHLNNEGVKVFLMKNCDGDYQIKKFADKLKDITCLLIGCSRKQLEDEEFKNKSLGEDWVTKKFLWIHKDELQKFADHKGMTIEEVCENYPYEKYDETTYRCSSGDQIMTPRLMMQLIGTECGREILHPDIWVNSTLSLYEPHYKWIVTDVRFINEVDRIKKLGGLVIRVVRDVPIPNDEHISEKSLDGFNKFDYTIHNDGDIDDLINNCRTVIKNLKLC